MKFQNFHKVHYFPYFKTAMIIACTQKKKGLCHGELYLCSATNYKVENYLLQVFSFTQFYKKLQFATTKTDKKEDSDHPLCQHKQQHKTQHTNTTTTNID